MKKTHKPNRGTSSDVLRESSVSKLIVKPLGNRIKTYRSEGAKQQEAILREIEKVSGLVEVIASHLKRQEDEKLKASPAASA